VNVIRLPTHVDTLFDLLTAYSRERLKRAGGATYRPVHAPVLLIEEARELLERMLGRIPDWSGLSSLLPFDWSGGPRRRSAMASMLLACLELARDGKLEIRQLQPFDEVYVKERREPRVLEAVS
jgi:segregation and condensation protein A